MPGSSGGNNQTTSNKQNQSGSSKQAAKNNDVDVNTQSTAAGKRKAEFIKKALHAKTTLEKLTVVRQEAGDQVISQMYTLNDDYVFRFLFVIVFLIWQNSYIPPVPYLDKKSSKSE